MPFCLIAAWGLIASLEHLDEGSGDVEPAPNPPRAASRDRLSRLGAVGLGVLVVSLTATSPVMQTGLGEWKAQGVYNERFLAAFDDRLEEMEPGSKV